VTLLEDQVAHQLAGLAYLQSQPFVDTTRITVMGGSFGGIQTLLGAEANPGYGIRAANSWMSRCYDRSRIKSVVHMGDAVEFRDLLRRYRAAASFTQGELAARANLSERAVSDLERGVRRAPHRDISTRG